MEHAVTVERLRIIFGRSNTAVSLLIRFFDICPYGHVAIQRDDYVYESVGSRYKGKRNARKGFIKTKLVDFKKRYSAWQERFIILPVGKTVAAVYDKCDRFIEMGIKYDFWAVIGSLWLIQVLRIKLGHKWDMNCAEVLNEIIGVFTHGVVTLASWYNISRPMWEW